MFWTKTQLRLLGGLETKIAQEGDSGVWNSVHLHPISVLLPQCLLHFLSVIGTAAQFLLYLKGSTTFDTYRFHFYLYEKKMVSIVINGEHTRSMFWQTEKMPWGITLAKRRSTKA